ncbi:MAG: hypothetical protein H7Z21_04565, partial [Hymenobacter sp.]|nr:hypothetical protein [Hymenobacter sp.]
MMPKILAPQVEFGFLLKQTKLATPEMMPKILAPQVEFGFLLKQTKLATPEIFAADGTAFL